MYKNNSFILVLFLLFGIACETDKKQEAQELVILHINDIHAKIDQMPKIADLVAQEREKHPHLLVLLAGDLFSGNPFVDYHPEKGSPIIELLSAIEPDLSVIGNHEFDYGQEVLEKRIQDSNFSWVLANIESDSGFLSEIPAYKSFEFPTLDFSLAIVGLVQVGSNGIPASHPDNLKGLSFSNGLDRMEDFLSLKEEHQSLMVLSHLGINSEEALADRYPEIDAIVGGHSHTVIEEAVMRNGVLIGQAGADGNFIGKMVFTIQDGEIVDKKGSLIDVRNHKDEVEELRQKVQEYKENEALNRTLISLEKPISGKQELGCLMTDAVKEVNGLDFVFQNGGGIRLRELPAGDVKVKDIYTLDPFGNSIIRFMLSKKEIENLIMSKLRKKDPFIDLYVAGMDYTIKTKNGEFSALEMTLHDGKAWEEDKKYAVGLNSYIASVYSFEKEDEGEDIFIETAASIVQFLDATESLDYSSCERVKMQ